MSVQFGFKAEEIIAEGRVATVDIQQINIWLKEQKNLPVITDEEIINFLLSNDNDHDKTKNTVKAFFKIRKEAPDIFNNRFIPEKNSESKQTVTYFGIAPRRTIENCAVVFSRFYDTRFQNFNLVQFIKFLLMTLDASIYASPPSGLIVIVDLHGCGIMHLTKLKVGTLSVLFRYLQEALPVKLKNVHILNTPYFIDKLLAIIRPLMNDYLNELIIFHKIGCNMDEFFVNYVVKQLLPEEFGGELPCMKDLNAQLIKNLESMQSYFTAEEYQRSALKS